ncbi:hypothetical protein A2153_01710 [Candidatus Gottesmanbacteria bacterium RBG_16_38_7b]|uniref:Antitoxin n=1 Tax=Candidatus Gottesmanbacteria bacterium RBG_16_38_7b TaxID=1798372 RepID=A0A1F5YFU3_9BACT|nr:MAG: hypothetical protein A2153_01710 [Candidatus Gottesmanbacteria bacterium RBG_16_38_7b]
MNYIIPVHLARRNLGELLNQAFYQGTPFMLTRGDKPMAALIGVKEFKRILELIDKYDPGLADTLAVLSNQEVQKILSQGEEDIKTGNLTPLEKV